MLDTLPAAPAATKTAGTTRGHATPVLAEADRLMTVCNSCRYCEGLCAVFPAMEMRRAFPDGDLDYLANLCHSCGACYVDCQFSPPHEFNVNVPKVLAQVREESWARYVWPRAMRPVFDRNGLWISVAAAAAVALFIGGFVLFADRDAFFNGAIGPNSFYRLMPHTVMAGLFGAVFLYALLAMGMGLRAFWRAIGARPGELVQAYPLAKATHDATTLKYLDGGGTGCYNADAKPSDRRKLWHHLTFYGFLLCFASTSTATLYHYLLGREAPYPWWDLPVVLGTLGGIGLLVGPLGLLHAKLRRDPILRDDARTGMDTAFILMLFLTSATGIALLLLRATPALGTLLAIHLGVVFALFLAMPYSKFVHGLYRFAALVRSAKERTTINV